MTNAFWLKNYLLRVCKCISKYTFEMEAKITINHDYLSHLSHHIWLPHKSCKSLEENKYVFLFTPSLSSFTDMSNISYVISFRVSALLFAQNGKFGKLGKNVSSFTMDVTQTLDLEFPCIKPGMATNNFLLRIFFLNPDWILINIDISPQDILGGYYSLLLVPNQGCFNWSSWTSNDEIVKIKKLRQWPYLVENGILIFGDLNLSSSGTASEIPNFSLDSAGLPGAAVIIVTSHHIDLLSLIVLRILNDWDRWVLHFYLQGPSHQQTQRGRKLVVCPQNLGWLALNNEGTFY